MDCRVSRHPSSTQHQLDLSNSLSQYSASAVGLRAAHHVHSMHLLQIQLQPQHIGPPTGQHSFPANSNTTKDLHTSSYPAYISTPNSIPSSRTAQLSDIPPNYLAESLSSIDSVTECTDDPFTHTPHPINQTVTGSPTNPTSFIGPFRIVTINFQSCRNKTQELEHLISSVKQDVIIGRETWLNSTIN